jgi:hypothetical protein
VGIDRESAELQQETKSKEGSRFLYWRNFAKKRNSKIQKLTGFRGFQSPKVRGKK